MEAKKLILIIDDEPDFVETIQFFLENANFRIITARTGKEGIEKVHLLKPDLILLDLKMPEMNGHEVCRRLKENKETRHVPIIVLTVADETLDKVEALNLGVADYIGKNFSFEEILARTKAVLRTASPATGSEAVEEKNKKIVELRKIIDGKNIRILFHPILELSSRKPIGYEALTRGPKGSFLENPLFLFDLASEADMFFELDVLSRSLSIKKATFIKQEQLLFLNTNPGVFDTEHFKKMQFLEGSALNPPQICFEISERTSITSFTKLSSKISYFKDKGVKIAIDDVGAGYSSLMSIAELKPEFIKIDIALVRGIDSNEIKKSVVQALVVLADKLKCHLIAEGIETEKEHNALLALGVKYGQGFLFSRPSEHP